MIVMYVINLHQYVANAVAAKKWYNAVWERHQVYERKENVKYCII